MILKFQQQMMSESVALSAEVNQSEQDTNFHNRAIAWLLYAAGNCFCAPWKPVKSTPDSSQLW